MKNGMTSLELIYYCAFKYVIGKHSDLVNLIADALIDKICWSNQFMAQVLDEIHIHEKAGQLGMDIDIRKWYNVKVVFIERLKES